MHVDNMTVVTVGLDSLDDLPVLEAKEEDEDLANEDLPDPWGEEDGLFDM